MFKAVLTKNGQKVKELERIEDIVEMVIFCSLYGNRSYINEKGEREICLYSHTEMDRDRTIIFYPIGEPSEFKTSLIHSFATSIADQVKFRVERDKKQS